MAQKPGIPQGTRDFGPLTLKRRKYVMETLETVFRTYGFMPLETPAMEQLSTLTGKYGDEGDQLLFKILNSGDYFSKLIEHQQRALGHEEIDRTFLPSLSGKVSDLDAKRTLPFIAEKGLRYDLTVPFARYVVMNRNEITLPFRRYQMQPVWRADRPQKGRYREFWQCDADVVGSNSLLIEAELIKLYDEVFTRLQLPVRIRLNNRKLLNALATAINAESLFGPLTVAIDKLDKIGMDGMQAELLRIGLSEEQAIQVLEFLSLSGSEETLSQLNELFVGNQMGEEGTKELLEVFEYLKMLQIKNPVTVDVTLARGLTYYTGAIVEVVANAGSLKSSIGGGGRYDNLTGIFGMPGLSGMGISFGLDRICDVMEELNLFPEDLQPCPTHILFCHFDAACYYRAIELCAAARKAGVPAEVYPDLTKKIGKQLEYANKLKIPFACLIGPDELQQDRYVMKDLNSGEQREMSRADLLNQKY